MYIYREETPRVTLGLVFVSTKKFTLLFNGSGPRNGSEICTKNLGTN